MRRRGRNHRAIIYMIDLLYIAFFADILCTQSLFRCSLIFIATLIPSPVPAPKQNILVSTCIWGPTAPLCIRFFVLSSISKWILKSCETRCYRATSSSLFKLLSETDKGRIAKDVRTDDGRTTTDGRRTDDDGRTTTDGRRRTDDDGRTTDGRRRTTTTTDDDDNGRTTILAIYYIYIYICRYLCICILTIMFLFMYMFILILYYTF